MQKFDSEGEIPSFMLGCFLLSHPRLDSHGRLYRVIRARQRKVKSNRSELLLG